MTIRAALIMMTKALDEYLELKGKSEIVEIREGDTITQNLKT